jgi:DNA replication protein DnaC
MTHHQVKSFITRISGGKTIITERRISMLNEQTIEKLYAMRLPAMAEAFREQLEVPNSCENLTFQERFGLLVDRQWSWKEDRRMQRLLKNAKLKITACVEDIDYKTPRGIDKTVMLNLSSCLWIKKHQNVIIVGPTGAGKTFLACALANKACRENIKAFYTRVPRLLQDLAMAQADGSYPQMMTKLAKICLLILDDFGLAPMTDLEQRNLLEVIEDRNNTGSTIITSQLPVNHWHEIMDNSTISDAILDRLVHKAHRIILKGESMRKKN